MKKFMIITDGNGDGYVTYLTKKGGFTSNKKHGLVFFSERRAYRVLAKQSQYIQEVATVAEV